MLNLISTIILLYSNACVTLVVNNSTLGSYILIAVSMAVSIVFEVNISKLSNKAIFKGLPKSGLPGTSPLLIIKRLVKEFFIASKS